MIYLGVFVIAVLIIAVAVLFISLNQLQANAQKRANTLSDRIIAKCNRVLGSIKKI